MHRVLVRQGLNRLAVPTGTRLRQVVRYEHPEPGSMIHVDVKKLGRIPVGGGWHAHGRGTAKALASKRTGLGTGRVGYTYLHTALDDHSRLAYTEALDDEKAVTASDWWLRAAGFFAEYGITRIARVLTDNGSCLPVAALGASPRMHWDRAQADPALHPAHERESGAGSTAPWPGNGPTSANTTPRRPAELRWSTSSTTTTTTGPTPASVTSRRSPASRYAPTASPAAQCPLPLQWCTTRSSSFSASNPWNQRPETPHLGR